MSVTALRRTATDAHDAIIGYLLIVTDITARKQVEEERAKLDQRLRDQHFYTRSLIESNIDAPMTTDPRGIITDVNKQAEALTEAGLTLARDEQPALILMDIQLPGIDGLGAIALLKQDPLTRDIPIIALTALVMNGDEARIRAAGCQGYIAKPMRYREFLAEIARHLEPESPPACPAA